MEQYFIAHFIAILLGFILDLVLGDPYSLPHPIRWIGAEISYLEKRLYPKEGGNEKKLRRGILLVALVLFSTVTVSTLVFILSYKIHRILGILAEGVLTYYLLAAKCLAVESGKVYQALKSGDLAASRKAVSMIVGRDTAELSSEGIAKAAVETVAENISDGVIAPLFYAALGGPVLGFFYKAVNTMDSMIAYKNERYLYFGRAAAKLDDVMNFLPSRLSAVLMLLGAMLDGRDYDVGNAMRIFRRDRFRHSSPNSAQTESVMAGALSVELAGPASYFGKIVEKPTIGDAKREIVPEDILRANRLMYLTEFLCMVFIEGGILLLWGIFQG